MQAAEIYINATGTVSAVAPPRTYIPNRLARDPSDGAQCGGEIWRELSRGSFQVTAFPQSGAGGGHGGVGGECCHGTPVGASSTPTVSSYDQSTGGEVKGIISSSEPPWEYGGYGGPCTTCVRNDSEPECCRYTCRPCVTPSVMTRGGGRIR